MTQNRRQTLAALLAAAAAAAATAFARQDAPAPQAAAPLPPVSSDELIARARAALVPGGLVDGLMDRLVEQERFSGVVLASVEGRPLLHKAYGLADRATKRPNALDTRFNIASAGKMFTTVAIGQLLDEGKLSLDDRLSRHLPDFRPEFGRTVTIGQLLTHHSGLGSYFASPLWEARRASIRTLADYLDLVRDEQPRFAPGARYEYSNSGFTLLGAVIEAPTGQDYYDAIRAAVAAGLAVAVAGTRVFLGVHWLTDVLAGLMLGWAWFALGSIAFGGGLLVFGAPIATAEHIVEVTAATSQR